MKEDMSGRMQNQMALNACNNAELIVPEKVIPEEVSEEINEMFNQASEGGSVQAIRDMKTMKKSSPKPGMEFYDKKREELGDGLSKLDVIELNEDEQ
jgi:hypothetical protein